MAQDQEDKTLGSIEPEEADAYDLVDLYVAYNFAEVEMIRDILLDNSIDCYVHKMSSESFPIDVGKHGQIRISVPKRRVDDATALLTEAIDEGALTGDGAFMTDDQTF
jgi:hypothetical protein